MRPNQRRNDNQSSCKTIHLVNWSSEDKQFKIIKKKDYLQKEKESIVLKKESLKRARWRRMQDKVEENQTEQKKDKVEEDQTEEE